MVNTLTPQQRAAVITYAIVTDGAITTDQIRRLSGIASYAGITHIMANIAAVVPIHKPRRAVWQLQRRPGETLVEGANVTE